MSVITLDEAKQQCSVDEDFEGHDDRLERLMGEAVAWAVKFCNVSSIDDLAIDSPATEWPEDLRGALLMHVEAHFDKDPQMLPLLVARAEEMLWRHRSTPGL